MCVKINEIQLTAEGRIEIKASPFLDYSIVLLLINSEGLVESQVPVSGTMNSDSVAAFTLPTRNPTATYTYVITDTFTGITDTTDFDTDNDGTVDNTTTLGTVLDALGALINPDAINDNENVYGNSFGMTDVAFGGSEQPTLIFRDASRNNWYLLTDNEATTESIIYNPTGSQVDTSLFASPPTPTFGFVNPTFVGNLDENVTLVSWEHNQYTLCEGESITVNLQITESSSALTQVEYSTTGGMEDFQLFPSSSQILPTNSTVTLHSFTDTLLEADETFALQITSATSLDENATLSPVVVEPIYATIILLEHREPTVVGEAVELFWNQVETVDVLSNDADPRGDQLTIVEATIVEPTDAASVAIIVVNNVTQLQINSSTLNDFSVSYTVETALCSVIKSAVVNVTVSLPRLSISVANDTLSQPEDGPNGPTSTTATVSREGSITSNVTVTISVNATGVVTVPDNILLSGAQREASFPITTILSDTNQRVSVAIAISAPDMIPDTLQLTIYPDPPTPGPSVASPSEQIPSVPPQAIIPSTPEPLPPAVTAPPGSPLPTSPASQPPQPSARCAAIVPFVIEGGTWQDNGCNNATTCTLTCSDGWQLNNAAGGSAVCNNGVWSGSDQSCTRKTCTGIDPVSISNGQWGNRGCTGAASGSECALLCNTNFAFSGDGMATCGSNNTFEDTQQTCEGSVTLITTIVTIAGFTNEQILAAYSSYFQVPTANTEIKLDTIRVEGITSEKANGYMTATNSTSLPTVLADAGVVRVVKTTLVHLTNVPVPADDDTGGASTLQSTAIFLIAIGLGVCCCITCAVTWVILSRRSHDPARQKVNTSVADILEETFSRQPTNCSEDIAPPPLLAMVEELRGSPPAPPPPVAPTPTSPYP